MCATGNSLLLAKVMSHKSLFNVILNNYYLTKTKRVFTHMYRRYFFSLSLGWSFALFG